MTAGVARRSSVSRALASGARGRTCNSCRLDLVLNRGGRGGRGGRPPPCHPERSEGSLYVTAIPRAAPSG